MRRILNHRQQSTLNCVKHIRTQITELLEQPAKITADDLSHFSIDVQRQSIELPDRMFVGPFTHSDCRRIAKAEFELTKNVLIEKSQLAVVCELELLGKPLLVHMKCPEGAIYAPPGEEEEQGQMYMKWTSIIPKVEEQ